MGTSKFLKRFTATAAATGVVLAGGVVASTPAQAWSVAVWDAVAKCESSNRWNINTGNGYYGGLQFSSATWAGYGGRQYAPQAHLATKEQQIAIARRTLAGQGPGAWPTCGRRAGLTKTNGGADRYAQPLSATQTPTRPTTQAPAPAPATGKLVVNGVMNRDTVRALQRWVGATPDGIWGRQTTRALQKKVGARVDGIRGPETYRKTQRAIGASQTGRWNATSIRALQTYLNKVNA